MERFMCYYGYYANISAILRFFDFCPIPIYFPSGIGYDEQGSK